MCFEILGFDIILDQLAKPYLLEVNHAPSFNTDTSLDYLVKKQLMRDTFTLLNINVEDKKQQLLQIHEDKQIRLWQKISLKQKIDSQNQILKERNKALEEYEALNLGGFERIYPS